MVTRANKYKCDSCTQNIKPKEPFLRTNLDNACNYYICKECVKVLYDALYPDAIAIL